MSGRPEPTSFFRRRPLLALSLAFSVGICFDHYFSPGVRTLTAYALLSFFAVLCVFLYKPAVLKPGSRWIYAGFAAIFLSTLSGGMLRHAQSTRLFPADAVERRTPTSPALFWMEAETIEIQRKLEPNRQVWILHVLALGSTETELSLASGTVQVLVRRPTPELETLGEGSRVRFLTRLEAPAASTLPDGFDTVSYLAMQDIRRVGEADAASVKIISVRPWYRVDRALRHYSAVRSTQAQAMLEPATASISNALLFGRRETLESGDRDAFAHAGTAHLLAISGLHLNLLAWVIGWSLGKLGYSRRFIAGTVLLVSIAYVFASGAPDSILRAAIMNAAYAGALWFRREADPFSAWSAAALAVLFFRPADLFQPGFQLSFASVFALLAVYPAFESAWESLWPAPEANLPKQYQQPDHRSVWFRPLRQTLFVSLAAWLGTAPIVTWHMGFFSPVTILSNLFAVPICFVAMLAGILMQALDTVGLPCLPDLLSVPTFILLGFNRWAAQWPGASWEASPPSPVLLLLIAAIIVALWADRGNIRAPLRTAILAPAALAVLCISSFMFPTRWEDTTGGAPRITLLDLTRGRSAWVELPGGGHALIDAGGVGQGRRISEVLRREGVSEITLLAITEDDPDAIGGALELATLTNVNRVLLPESSSPSDALRAMNAWATQRGIAVLHAESQNQFHGPGLASWRALSDAQSPEHPGKKLPGIGSESIALRLEYPGSSALFVRAHSNPALQRLITAHEKELPADLLVLSPGRGERWPLQTDQLLSKTQPKKVIAQDLQHDADTLSDSDEEQKLTAWCGTQGVPVLFVKKEGTLRITRTTQQAYAGGTWRELK